MAEPWSDFEIRVALDSYFVLLLLDLTGTQYSKAEHKKRVAPLIPARSEDALEYKWSNISAVLDELGRPWVAGFKPLSNYQERLRELVAVWIADHPYEDELLRERRLG